MKKFLFCLALLMCVTAGCSDTSKVFRKMDGTWQCDVNATLRLWFPGEKITEDMLQKYSSLRNVIITLDSSQKTYAFQGHREFTTKVSILREEKDKLFIYGSRDLHGSPTGIHDLGAQMLQLDNQDTLRVIADENGEYLRGVFTRIAGPPPPARSGYEQYQMRIALRELRNMKAALAELASTPQEVPQAESISASREVPLAVTGQLAFEDGKVRPYTLRLRLSIASIDPEAAKAIKNNMPQIQEQMVLHIGTKTYDDLRPASGKNKLKLEILDIINGVIGRKAASDVFFTEIIIGS